MSCLFPLHTAVNPDINRESPPTNVEHLETGNCLSYAFLEDEDPNSAQSPSNVRARFFALAVLDGSSAPYRDGDGALALRNLAEAVREHPCVLRKGSELEFAAGLFREPE